MTRPKDRITSIQAAVIVTSYILGAGILTLPRTAAEAVKTPDIWISVILGGLIAMAAGGVLAKLAQQYPDQTFYVFVSHIAGKWLGAFIALGVIGYFCLIAAFEMRAMAEVTQFYLLEGTPIWAIVMPFIWVGLYLILGGINPIARLFEIIFPITVIIFLVVITLGFGIFELNHMRPVLGLGIKPVLHGIKSTTLTFTGPEIMLILVAFMREPVKASKAVWIGTAIPIIFYVITVVMVIGGLSVDAVVTRTWPTLDLIRNYEIKGLIFERFESMLLVIWIMQIFSTFTITYYAASLGLSQLFNRNISPIMFGLTPVLFLITLIPRNMNDVFKFGDWIGYMAVILFGVMPMLLLIISKWRGSAG